MARVVVVGAGLAGLCTALALSDFGHDVTVLEAADRPGGQLSGDDVDLGAPAFTLPAVLRDLFRKTGRPLERELGVAPVEPAVRLVFAQGGHVDVPNATRAGAMRALDEALGDGAGAQWDAVVQHGERTWRRLRPAVVGHDDGVRAGSRRTGPGRDGPGRGADGSLHDVATGLLRDDRLRSFLGTYATAIGEQPSTAPAALTALPYMEQTFGMWTVGGGMRRLAEVLHDRAAQRGTRFRFGARVAEVVDDGGRVSAVRLAEGKPSPAEGKPSPAEGKPMPPSGELVSADVVVWAAPTSLLPADLLGGRRQPRRHWWSRDNLGPRDAAHSSATAAASVLTVVVARDRADDERPAELPLRTIVFPGEGAAVTVVAQPGGWVLHAPAPPHTLAPTDETDAIDWTAPGRAAASAAELLATVGAAGVDLGRSPVASTVRTPYDLERELSTPGGRVHGGSGVHGDSVALLRRPANLTRLRGLYLAGAGAHPGPGVPLVAISAAIVTDLVGRP
ncbi:phytoene desaturase family protein [Jiangella asiatica]|uniref:NAD(P)/FAD-dependent oxidoreductase n=1 Tax=Jiangella asiatica TaxID=2530372 RepID=A0A4R5CC12_9ACTN|nr:NAD(P)/FAD-dependent oxidoreductase [Jiangella asiatica]TDD96399.1 NAD(P)/FAD-dependent oxidoreductase [Jiangella asiatica]